MPAIIKTKAGWSELEANPGEPWSKTDIDDLKASLAFGNGIAATANMLCRDEDEVREKERPIYRARQLAGWWLPPRQGLVTVCECR